MHRIDFRTDTPLDDLPRALDILRKLNYRLRAVAMTADDEGPARISISFSPNGLLSVETFAALVQRLPGVVDARHVAPAVAAPARQNDASLRESVFA
ncbi:hypothetical protein [Phreatobacter stygius]|uniref:ACT domain-containing protein n=1 Tax=Phreatobacter stygius TaxID=1940610 RepID=A0A4D7B8Z3_9HYPH|nr:hypothetical protein [Phreatobacter stygius]QCI67273.1 hypothetical protein E8M01_25415 [Phreatobacter stygius]